MLRDNRALRAYLLTKAVVLTAAAVLTIPLSRWLGPVAWYGLLAFAVALAFTTLAVIGIGRLGLSAATEPASEEPEEDQEEPDSDSVELPIEDCIDLHSFPPAEIPAVVGDYLQAAHARGLVEVRLIHGRGIGVQRERVRSLLSSHPLVHSFHDAPPELGGWGATVARLRGGRGRAEPQASGGRDACQGGDSQGGDAEAY